MNKIEKNKDNKQPDKSVPSGGIKRTDGSAATSSGTSMGVRPKGEVRVGPKQFSQGYSGKPSGAVGVNRRKAGIPSPTGSMGPQQKKGQYKGPNNPSFGGNNSGNNPSRGSRQGSYPQGGKYSQNSTYGGRNSKYQNITYQKTIFTRKVAKAVKGGRNMSFCSITVVGNQQGHVGIGVGKSRKISNAIDKSLENARNSMITPIKIIPMKFRRCATEVIIKLRKNDILRTPSYISEIFEAAGYKNVSCKLIKSKNIMNAIFCVFDALKQMNKLNKIQAQVNGLKSQS